MFQGLDPQTLDPKLQATYKGMQAAYTTKTQALADRQRALDEQEAVFAQREAQALAQAQSAQKSEGEIESLGQLRDLWRQDQAAVMRPVLDSQVQAEITELKNHPKYGALFTEHLSAIAKEVRQFHIPIKKAFFNVCGEQLMTQGGALAVKELEARGKHTTSTKPGPIALTTEAKKSMSLKESWEATKAELGSPWE